MRFPRLFPVALLPLLAACTAADPASEKAAPSRASETTAPAAVNSDAERRAIYESNGGTTGQSPVPDATPNTLRLGEEAAGINTHRRVGSLNTNDPDNTTPETQMQRLDYDPPQPQQAHPEINDNRQAPVSNGH